MPALKVPSQLLQAPPTGQSAIPRSDTIGGVAPVVGTGSSGFKQSGLPPGGLGLSDDPVEGDSDKCKREKDINAKRNGVFIIDSAVFCAAYGRSRESMKCEVERFERGTNLIITD